MVASYYGYASDITVTFPINGKFTEKQRIVYSIVLQAREMVFKHLAPGINIVVVLLFYSKILYYRISLCSISVLV